MAIKTNVEPYTLLVRWKDGKLAGVMKRDLLRTVKDGKELKAQELPAEPVAEKDVPACIPAADSIAEVSRLLAVEAEQKDEIENLTGERDRLLEEVRTLKGLVEQLTPEIEQLKPQVEAS